LVTSIDLRIQYLAYRELKVAMQQYQARAGSVIVVDVDTGEVLAMVNQPSYNPNDREQLKPELYRNRAATGLQRQAVHHGGRALVRSVPARQRGGHLAGFPQSG
jgi:cell division protein FtsI/penicillin-binding protein 2